MRRYILRVLIKAAYLDRIKMSSLDDQRFPNFFGKTGSKFDLQDKRGARKVVVLNDLESFVNVWSSYRMTDNLC